MFIMSQIHNLSVKKQSNNMCPLMFFLPAFFYHFVPLRRRRGVDRIELATIHFGLVHTGLVLFLPAK